MFSVLARRMKKDTAIAKETTAQLQRNVEKAVKKLHEDFSNIFSKKSGLNWDVDASSDESGSDDQPMDDAQGSAEVSTEAAQPTEELSAPAEREVAEGE